MFVEVQKILLVLSLLLTIAYAYESPLDEKDFKKLLKQNKNILVLCAPNDDAAKPILRIFKQVEPEIKGRGLLAFVNCDKSKKLCKKYKLESTNSELRHFNDGEFHKVYDRAVDVKPMINFMLDPKGEQPWYEETLAQDVAHLHAPKDLQKVLKQKLPVLVMFYAPWCGYCKRLKPAYAEAATETRGEFILAGMDVDRVENAPVRRQFNITGFPTIIYFENGEQKFPFSGGHTKDEIVSWLRNPQAAKDAAAEKEEDTDFFQIDGNSSNYIVHLNDTNFDSYIAEHSQQPILTMFYAPWCGHCKNLKPELVRASVDLHEQDSNAVIAAIDATKSPVISKQHKISGYPTMKFFRDGKFAFNIQERSADKIVNFLKDPKEPPPPEPEWSEQVSDVIHLEDENFKSILKKKKSALVLFYAPWCGHCKRAKPLYTNAAATLRDNPKIAFCAIDCTKAQSLCKEFDISGYPTIKYFSFGKFVADYESARTEEAFVEFMKNPDEELKKPPPTPPSSNPLDFWKDSAPGYEFVHMLTSATFDTILSSSRKALVMFYAPWCGHCKTSKPAFASAAAKLATQYKDIIMAAVDGSSERDLTSKFSIQGFPTFKYFENGQLSTDYPGGRSEQDFLTFLTGTESGRGEL